MFLVGVGGKGHVWGAWGGGGRALACIVRLCGMGGE